MVGRAFVVAPVSETVGGGAPHLLVEMNMPLPPRYRKGQDVTIQSESTLTRRRTRAPQFPFALHMRPWVLYPCLCAPVLPGETLKNAVVQARVVSDPLVSNVQGWWLEFYAFYVRAGDFAAPDDDNVRNLAASLASTWAGTNDAVDWGWNHGNANLPSFAKRATAAVVKAYFRTDVPGVNTAESEPASLDGTLPTVGVAGSSYWDSVQNEPAQAFGASPVKPSAGASSWEQQWFAFQNLRNAVTREDFGVAPPGSANFNPAGGTAITGTFRDYLAQSGVRVAPQLKEDVAVFQRPELIRFVRDFAYPVPTVDNATGAIRSTVQWSLGERIDKRRFLAEPGFILCYMCARPKVFLSNVRGQACDLILNTSQGWVHPALDAEPHTNMKQLTTADIVQNGTTTVAWMDVRDLFLRGDQWTNFNPTGTLAAGTMCNRVVLPSADVMNKRYPALTDAQGVFVDGGGGGTAQFLHADGMVSLRVASRLGGQDVSV